jgi:hypothetical protein
MLLETMVGFKGYLENWNKYIVQEKANKIIEGIQQLCLDATEQNLEFVNQPIKF